MGANDEQTLTIPVFPLELTLLPGEPQVLRIYEPRYKQMLDDCLLDEAPFGLCLIDPFHPITGWAGPHLVGTTARITEHEEVGSNHMIEIQGQRRFRILKLIEPSLPPMDPVQHRVFPDLESLLQLATQIQLATFQLTSLTPEGASSVSKLVRPKMTKNDQKRPKMTKNDQKNTKIDQKNTKIDQKMTKIQIKEGKN